MAWADITLPTDTYTDLSPVIYVQDQNGDFMQEQDGTFIETQGSLDDFWVDITDAAIFLTDQNGDIMYTQDGNPMIKS